MPQSPQRQVFPDTEIVMGRIPSLLTLTACLALCCGRASAQGHAPTWQPAQLAPPQMCPTPAPFTPVTPIPPIPKEGEGAQPPVPDAAQPPSTDAFAQAPPAGGAETGGFNPSMFGDQLGHSISSSSSSNRPAA